MVFEFYNQSLLSQTNLFNQMDLIYILIFSILSIIIIKSLITIEDEHDLKIFLTIDFFGLFILFFALLLFLNGADFGLAFSFILICEAIFWQGIKYTRKSEEVHRNIQYIYNPYTTTLNTSVISAIYLIFVFIFLNENNFSINETNANLIGTLLLISVLKTLHGINVSRNSLQFYQLQFYGYIFVAIAIFLTNESFIESIFFNFTGYLMVLYSGNEISHIRKDEFNLNTFIIMLFLLFISAIISMFNTATIAPLVPLCIIGLLIIGTLVKIKHGSYDEENQTYLFIGLFIVCFILYFVLTGEIIVISQLFDLFEFYYPTIIDLFKNLT